MATHEERYSEEMQEARAFCKEKGLDPKKVFSLCRADDCAQAWGEDVNLEALDGVVSAVKYLKKHGLDALDARPGKTKAKPREGKAAADLKALQAAARAVLDAWESGDLAGAVRDLDACLKKTGAAHA